MKAYRALSTLCIPVLGLLIGIIIFGVVSSSFKFFTGQEELMSIISIGIFGSLFSFFFYGIYFWLPVILVTGTIEFVAIRVGRIEKKNFGKLLMVETILLSIPFAY